MVDARPVARDKDILLRPRRGKRGWSLSGAGGASASATRAGGVARARRGRRRPGTSPRCRCRARATGVRYGRHGRQRAGRAPGRASSCRRRRRRRRGSRRGARGRRARDVAGQDAVAEAGREALDLRLHALHLRGVSASQSTPCGPCVYAHAGVLALRRARRVGERLLADQQERALGHARVACQASVSSTSASSPPTCTVPASRASGASHGIGAVSAQSTLTVAGPWR